MAMIGFDNEREPRNMGRKAGFFSKAYGRELCLDIWI
jgi:hypothetical protein